MLSVGTLVALTSFFSFCLLGHDFNGIKLLILIAAFGLTTLVQFRIIGIFYQIFALLILEHRE